MIDFEHERLEVYLAVIAWLIIADEIATHGLGLGMLMYRRHQGSTVLTWELVELSTVVSILRRGSIA